MCKITKNHQMKARHGAGSSIVFPLIMLLVAAAISGGIYYLGSVSSAGGVEVTTYASTASSYDIYQSVWNSVQITPNLTNPAFTSLNISRSLSYEPLVCPTNDAGYCPVDERVVYVDPSTGYGSSLMPKVDLSIVPLVFVAFYATG